jgi:DNA primase
MEQVATLYRKQLRRHAAAPRAVDYLKGRGLSGEVAAAFGLGYAPPGWDFLLRDLGRNDDSRRMLIQCGLLIDQDGKCYDRFRDRVMFPIRDRRGRIIGFGGRILGDGKPKYLNSPETAIFHKGRELYGLYEAVKSSRNLERLLVVEGYMDVIALAQFGVSYAVATLGTSTTPDHLHQLLPQAPELVFCFDGDRAGRDAAWKALVTSLPHTTGKQQIRFLFLPEGEDPDSLIRKEGRETFEERVRQAPPLSELLFDRLTAQVDMNSLDGKARLASLAEPLLKLVPKGIFRDMLNGRLASLVGVAADLLEPGQHGPRRPAGLPARMPPANRQATTPLRLAIALILQHPRLAPAAFSVDDDWREMDRPGVSILSELLDLIAAYPKISSAALLERWRDQDSYAHLGRLADPQLLAHIPNDGLEAELTGALQKLRRDAGNVRRENLFKRASTTEWTDEDKEALRRRSKQLHRKKP